MVRKDLIRLMSLVIVTAGMMAACAAPVLAQTPPATYSVMAIGPSTQGIVQAGDGNFYAPSLEFFEACQSDATKECAYIYQITPSGVMTEFHAFEAISTSSGPIAPNADGLWPLALIVGSDGNLYGACRYGGPGGFGTIFEITLTGTQPGTFSLLTKFGESDPGGQPLSLLQGSDGNFYFTNGVGIYLLTPAGVVSPLYTFTTDPVTRLYTNGANSTSLTVGSDGNFYMPMTVGQQTAPGTGNQGAIGQFNPVTNQFKVVHNLNPDGSEGIAPDGPLVEGPDGAFYGVTKWRTTLGGNPGVAFRVLPGGAYTPLHSFTGSTDGNRPHGALFLGSDGNFYGTTLDGGDSVSANCSPTGCGTVFQLEPGGVLTTLHTFEGGTPTSTVVADNPQFDGAAPEAPLVQANDGTFWGTSLFDAIFKITLNSAPPGPVKMTLKPTVVAAGCPTTVTLTVLNAFSQTAQVCGADIVGNATGAGIWNGVLKGTLTNGVYGGTATITPTAGGTYTYAISCGGNESAQATLLVTQNTDLQLAPPGPTSGAVSQPYQLILNTTGGQSPYFFVMAGTVPKGLTWNPSGTLTGTPLQFGDYDLSFGVHDSSTPPPPQTDAKSITLHIVSGLTLVGVAGNPVVGKYYAQNLIASGGLTPYTWKLASGTLPPGLQFNASAGQITGTPTQEGKFIFAITVSDFENPKAQVTTSFTLNTATAALDISSNGLLPDASVGVPYKFSAAATGGTPPYFWSLIPSAVPTDENPPGLTMSLSGIFSGIPIQYSLGYYNFYIQVTDSEIPPVSVNQYAAIKVNRTLKITGPTSLSTDTVGTTLYVPLTATGGIPPYKWKVSSFPDPDVIGLYVSGANIVEVPIIAANVDVTIEVTDSEVTNKDDAQIALPLVYLPAPLVTTTTLTSSNTAAGTGETVTFTAKVTISSGGAPPGQVIFYNGTTSLGTATLDATGTATLQTSFAANGVYTITAAYGGNQSYAASTSSPLTETVVTPGVTAAVTPASLTVQPGGSGQLVITITPTGGYTGTLQFSCGTLPTHVSCAFAPPSLTITAGGGPFTDTLTVSTNAPAVAMLLEPRSGGTRNSVFTAIGLWLPGSVTALLVLVGRKRRSAAQRRRNFWIIAILCLAGLGALTSCGGSNNNARAGTYTIPVTLTLAGGATQNISATVIVQ